MLWIVVLFFPFSSSVSPVRENGVQEKREDQYLFPLHILFRRATTVVFIFLAALLTSLTAFPELFDRPVLLSLAVSCLTVLPHCHGKVGGFFYLPVLLSWAVQRDSELIFRICGYLQKTHTVLLDASASHPERFARCFPASFRKYFGVKTSGQKYNIFDFSEI